MTEQHHEGKLHKFFNKIELSFLLTALGILFLFGCSIFVILWAPRFVDPSWTAPSSHYQMQMYEVADPSVYIGQTKTAAKEMQFVHHLKQNYTLLAFTESDSIRIIAPPELEKYVTRHDESTIKLTSRLLLLQAPGFIKRGAFDAVAAAAKLENDLKSQWEKISPEREKQNTPRINFEILELYDPQLPEAFSVGAPDTILEDWVDSNFTILDDSPKQQYHLDPGVIYVNNPKEYRISYFLYDGNKEWRYDPNGEKIANVEQITNPPFGFRSRKSLIELGEHIFAIEGCWYCHTDQTRTLVQDVVMNGSESYPAPPSSPNEYIYQKITFMGTKRNGPDISRTGIKRPSRDWHKGHFWSPKTTSRGSIMPSFRHFFDNDPRGTSQRLAGVPNYKFEAIYQYLMTKGTRITSPTHAWWLGKDPVKTIDIIDGLYSKPTKEK